MNAVYIHIPFCQRICSYCDFTKLFYNKSYVDTYLESLLTEIKTYYKGEVIKTLYIGGGTPTSLDSEELRKLLEILKIFKLDSNVEFTFECNIESITKEKLEIMKENGVNRLSIGIQTFNSRHLELLERGHKTDEVFERIDIAKSVGFKNISIDLIYAIPNQTIEELKEDLNLYLKLDIPHISLYSLIIEPHTKLYINKVKNIDEELDSEMYEIIDSTLSANGYYRYEVSNYCKPGYESKHNLNYWDNNEYYGFGLGASGYVDGIRYINMKSINQYMKGIFRSSEEKIDESLKIENELILGFRKIKGINKNDFYTKFGFDINDIPQIKKLLREGKLEENNEYIYIKYDYMYLSNSILVEFIGETYGKVVNV